MKQQYNSLPFSQIFSFVRSVMNGCMPSCYSFQFMQSTLFPLHIQTVPSEWKFVALGLHGRLICSIDGMRWSSREYYCTWIGHGGDGFLRLQQTLLLVKIEQWIDAYSLGFQVWSMIFILYNLEWILWKGLFS